MSVKEKIRLRKKRYVESAKIVNETREKKKENKEDTAVEDERLVELVIRADELERLLKDL